MYLLSKFAQFEILSKKQQKEILGGIYTAEECQALCQLAINCVASTGCPPGPACFPVYQAQCPGIVTGVQYRRSCIRYGNTCSAYSH